MRRALVVSVHDVAPGTRAPVEHILRHLRDRGVERCSLLVVPDYQHQGPSLGDPNFCAYLHEMQELGHEIVIHGFFHERARRRHETTREKLITRFYTADEGEFFDLDHNSAFKLIQRARNDFAAQGFWPNGFIAPAWLMSAEAMRAAMEAGMSYTTTLRTVRDFTNDREFVSQSLVYSVRSGWRRGLSLIWNRRLFSRLTTNELLRLSIHPPDLAHRSIWRQILETVDRALLNREAMTYGDWLQVVPLGFPENDRFSERLPR